MLMMRQVVVLMMKLNQTLLEEEVIPDLQMGMTLILLTLGRGGYGDGGVESAHAGHALDKLGL